MSQKLYTLFTSISPQFSRHCRKNTTQLKFLSKLTNATIIGFKTPRKWRCSRVVEGTELGMIQMKKSRRKRKQSEYKTTASRKVGEGRGHGMRQVGQTRWHQEEELGRQIVRTWWDQACSSLLHFCLLRVFVLQENFFPGNKQTSYFGVFGQKGQNKLKPNKWSVGPKYSQGKEIKRFKK